MIDGLEFPIIPDELKDLTPLETRFVAQRIPFMQIRKLKMGGQYGLKGGVVNVPVDVDTNVSILPRTNDNLYTVSVQLMKRMRDKNPYAFETVRPYKIFEAAKYLVEQPLYKAHNIKLLNDWLINNETSINKHDQIINNSKVTNESENNNLEQISHKNMSDNNDKDEKDFENNLENIRDFDIVPLNEIVDSKNGDEIIAPMVEETLLHNEFEDEIQAIKFAPGENKRPIGILFDKDFRELSNPTIRCGQKLKTKRELSLFKVIKSEFKRYDRRAAKDKTYIFTNYDMLRKKRLVDAINISLRKKNKMKH